MKKIFELIDLKNLALTIIVFIFLISILVIFFIIPTKKEIRHTQREIKKLKQKLEVHNNLLPIYLQLQAKLYKFKQNIDLTSNRITLMKFKNEILNLSPQFQVNVLSIYPELKKKIAEKNCLIIKLVLKGKYINFINLVNFLITNGYIYEIKYMDLESDIKSLNINLKVSIKI